MQRVQLVESFLFVLILCSEACMTSTHANKPISSSPFSSVRSLWLQLIPRSSATLQFRADLSCLFGQHRLHISCRQMCPLFFVTSVAVFWLQKIPMPYILECTSLSRISRTARQSPGKTRKVCKRRHIHRFNSFLLERIRGTSRNLSEGDGLM